jgi:CRP-like cAMP-binding protein/Fe-S-cluster-containing dehydrogenase component
MADEFLDEVTLQWEAEGLFARNIDGQLIRLEKVTDADYLKDVTLTIDGREVTVKKAVPMEDSQGNIVNDAEGQTVPRRTTIYDAAQRLFVQEPGDQNPIPTLCHREHMRPVGVCRVCCVEVYRENREKKVVPGSKLVPACHHPAEPGMIVHTINSPDAAASQRLRSAVQVLTELLAADHLLADAAKSDSAAVETNELAALAGRMQADRTRFASRERIKKRGRDDSSPLIAVNHDACILCERCKRGCDEIKLNHVIGRTGKGYTAGIAFDLDDPMEESTCVSCGECMVSCPTDALTFRKPIESDWHKQLVDDGNCDPVTVAELQQHPLFRALPYKWLKWNEASVVRRVLKKDEPLCWLGDYGSTAFILLRGTFGLWFKEPVPGRATKESATPLGWLARLIRRTRGRSRSRPDPLPPPRSVPRSKPDSVRTVADLILGEMTCMNDDARSATVVALEPSEVLEIRRNVLYVLQRNAAARKTLDKVYRERTLQTHLGNVSLFDSLGESARKDCIEFLRDKVQLLNVDPGQIIFRQGEAADAFYMVRLGYVKVSQRYLGQERVLDYLGPNKYFGEIGLLSGSKELSELEVPQGMMSKRTATCSALDDVELVVISGADFRELLLRHESLRDRFRELSQGLLQKNQQTRQRLDRPLEPFLQQGLYNAQKLLVLDLESCTRCDECVRACADTHGGVTRLVREGLRFDKYLVASACRSCRDPYCLVGCPVDSIHRESSLEIVIESHCIGCGQCAQNCPYGNINMVGFDEIRADPQNPDRKMAVVQQRATTCDLCQSVGVDASHPDDEVSCVYACPHNAAFRMSGEELLERLDAASPS